MDMQGTYFVIMQHQIPALIFNQLLSQFCLVVSKAFEGIPGCLCKTYNKVNFIKFIRNLKKIIYYTNNIYKQKIQKLFKK